MSRNTTILLGANASGKTSILEAIFFLAIGKSFRASSDTECISFGKELARIKGITQSPNYPITQLSNQQINIEIEKNKEENIDLELVLTRGEVMKVKTPLKKYSVNKVSKRSGDFVGRLKAVLFWPEDLQLVTDSPSLRRKYLDFVLIQTDREYHRTLISYERAIRQRNSLLEAIRERGAHRHQLLFWDQLLIKAGEYISKKRLEYIDFSNNFKFQIPNFKLANYRLDYDNSIISRDRLDQYANEEIAAGVTLVGPHRDDIKFRIKNEDYIDLAHYGSRGEQRLAVLWLKMAELSYIESVTAEKPVLLLDDILSELDHEHRQIIFDIIDGQQTIFTTTDKHFLNNQFLKDAKIIVL